jgi:hypothetical protein
MTTLRITFLWEEDEAMSYDDLLDQLMSLGAEDVEEEEIERPERPRRGGGPKPEKS